MTVRLNNVDTIVTFLRDRYHHAAKVRDSLTAMPESQRLAVLATADYVKETKTQYTITELSKIIPNLSYNKIRYALVGHKPHYIINSQQPPELTERGIYVDFRYGTHNPMFSYDGSLLYQHLTRKTDVAAPTEQELMEKRKDPEYYKAELDAAVEPDKNEAAPPVETECDNVHVRKWLVQALHQIYNANSMGADDNGMLTVDGSPLVGLFLVSADWANEHGMHTDWPGIPHNMEYAKREDVPE